MTVVTCPSNAALSAVALSSDSLATSRDSVSYVLAPEEARRTTLVVDWEEASDSDVELELVSELP